MENLVLWLACAALVVIAGFYIITPLFRKSAGRLDIDLFAETEMDRLLGRKAVVYRNLKDLEFEHKMGRLSDGDFQQLNASYKNEAAAILQQLDLLNASENLEEMIEKEAAARKSARYGSGSQQAPESSRCPSCGAEIIPGKKYCADCGQRIWIR